LEEWRDIPDYEGLYQASDLGRIKGLDRVLNFNKFKTKQWKGIVLSQGNLKNRRYLRVFLQKDGIKKEITVHRLVALTFIPNPENKPQVNHIGRFVDNKEGNRLDNRVVSLEWCTISENQIHAIEKGLKKVTKGDDCSWSKLTEKEVLEIRKIGKTIKGVDLSKKYNVSTALISMVLNKKIWEHL